MNFANGAYTAAFMHFFNDEAKGFWEEFAATANEIYMDASRGAAVFMDTINPFGNPYKNQGWYTGKEDWYLGSRGASEVGNISLSLATGKVAITRTSNAYAPINQVSRQYTAVSRWGRPGLQSGDFVMKGSMSRFRYFLSGKWQPGMGNQYASYKSGQTFYVRLTSLKSPSQAATATAADKGHLHFKK